MCDDVDDRHFMVLVRPKKGTMQEGPSWLAPVCGSDEAGLLWLLMRDGEKVTDFCIVTLKRGECPICKVKRIV